MYRLENLAKTINRQVEILMNMEFCSNPKHICPNKINVQSQIGAYRWEKYSKINKHTCMFIWNPRVGKSHNFLAQLASYLASCAQVIGIKDHRHHYGDTFLQAVRSQKKEVRRD